MAQPPLEVRTDGGKGVSTDKPAANPLYVQIADDLPQQFKTFNKTTGTVADSPAAGPVPKASALPAVSLFEGSRNGAATVDTKTEPAHDFTKERLMFSKSMSTIRCHGGNSEQNDFRLGNDYGGLQLFNSRSGDNKRLLEDMLKSDKTGTSKFSDAELKAFMEIINDPKRCPTKKDESETKKSPLPELKIEPKVETKVEAKTEPKAEPKVESKTEPKIEPKIEPKLEPKSEQKTEQKKEESLDPKSEPKSETKPEAKKEQATDLPPKAVEEPLTAFEQSIKDTGAYTVENVSEAYKAAGKEKDGVALLIVGENTPGSKELLEKLPQLKEQHPELTFVVVNKDKLDERLNKNPEDNQAKTWKAWVDQNLKDCHGQPLNYAFTSVQTLKADANGKPVPERVTSTHWGADIEAGLADQSQFAASGTARNAGDFKFEAEKPKAPVKIEEPLKPISVFRPKGPAEAVEFIQATRPELYGKTSTAAELQQRQEKYLEAIAVADKINPKYLSEQKQKVQTEIEKEIQLAKLAEVEKSPSDLPADSSKLDDLKKELTNLEFLEKAPSDLRAAMAIDLMYTANKEENVEKKAALKTLVEEMLRNSFKANPELAKNDDFDLHIFNQYGDTAKLAQEANASTQLTVDQINQQLKAIAKIGMAEEKVEKVEKAEKAEQVEVAPKAVEVPTRKATSEQAAVNLPKEIVQVRDTTTHEGRVLPRTTSCPKIERSLSGTCSGESRACNAARQSNCQSFCQSPRQNNFNGGCQSRRPILNFLRRRR